MSPSSRRLTDRVSWVKDHLRKKAAIAIGLWISAGVVCFLITAWLAAGNEGWRQGSDVPALFDALIVVWIAAGILVFRVGAKRWFGEIPLSRSIERAAGLRPGIVRGALELTRSVPEGVSGSLAIHAVRDTASDLDAQKPRDLVGDLGNEVAAWTRRGLIAATVSCITLVSLGFSAPNRTAKVWAGVSSPISTMLDPVLPQLLVSPGSVEVLRGTDVRIDIEALGRLGVQVAWQSAGDVSRTQQLEVSQGRASYVFQAVSAATEYRVRTSEGEETETYRIIPIDPLFVSDLVIGVTYPPHTRMAPDEYRGDAPPLRLPVGSRLTFEGLASRPLSNVELVDSAGATSLLLEVDGLAFQGVWTPRANGLFDWQFRDISGTEAVIYPDPVEIVMVPDSAPNVAILLPGQDTVMPLSLRQPLVVDGRDDYGLSRLELVSYRVTAFGERDEPVVQSLDMAGTRAALARPILDLTTRGLLPGDTLRYFARVVDNNPVSQTGESPEYALRMQDTGELRREVEATLESAAERLEELMAEVARQAEENLEQSLSDANQIEDAANPSLDEPDFEEREELLRALEEQAQLVDQVDSLLVEMQELEQRMVDAGQADPELTDELQELQDLLRQLGTEEMNAEPGDSEEAISQDPEEDQQSLDQLAGQQDEFRDRLEAALERFQRAALEQDFRATTQEAEELARQERALADAMREDDPELRADQQADLADQTAELDERMESLAQRLEELEEESASQQVEEARETISEARDRMEQAQDQASQGDSQDAGDQADQAADQLEEAASQLEQAQDAMTQMTMEQAQAAMQQTADDALSLARSQSNLRNRMDAASQDELAEMRSDQASILRGVENLAENLQAGVQSSDVDPALSAQIGQAMESLQRTADALDSRRSSSATPGARAEQAVGDLNQLALMAMAGAQAPGPVGEGQSGQDMVEQLGQLAQRQGELVSQTGELVPMRLGEQAERQQMQDISDQQQMVASDLGQLAEQPGADGTLGDLEELSRQAEILAQQLAEGRLTSEILRDQERLFHRLLDAGRALEKEEFSEERESEEPGAFERGQVVPLTAQQLGVMPYELPDGEQLRRLTPAVRQLVLEYFERLNRVGPEGGDS